MQVVFYNKLSGNKPHFINTVQHNTSVSEIVCNICLVKMFLGAKYIHISQRFNPCQVNVLTLKFIILLSIRFTFELILKWQQKIQLSEN